MSNNKKDNQEVFSKVAINWYPGHMAKTKRQIIEDLKLIDIVVEVLDARIPFSSQNPDVRNYTKDKSKIMILNKSDLADEKQTAKWIKYFKSQGISAVVTDANSGKGVNDVIIEIKRIAKENQEKYKLKGRIGKSVRVLILGIPNVGKSSFINRITKKATTIVGNKPGVTRQKQWIRLAEGIELMDTPGVLWPKFESEEVALNLAYTGTIKDDVLEKVEIAFNLIRYLIYNYKENLSSRYKLEISEIDRIMNQVDLEENEKIYEVMQQIAKKRGAILSGGRIDDEKISSIILDEFRSGKLGKITLEIAKI